MRAVIKKYELDDEVNMYKLTKGGFKRVEHDKEETFLQFHFSKELLDEITVNIDITINKDKKYIFDDQKDVELYDEAFCHQYRAFYDEDRDFPFLNDLIKEYNETMDGLVEIGIFKPKKLKKTKSLKNTK